VTPVGKSSLSKTHPELAAQADGWDPLIYTAGSNKKVRWKCDLGHIFMAVLASRTLRGTGCPVCSNRQLLVGYNDLATINSKLALEADGWDPITVVKGSGVRKNWICAFGHTWVATVVSRTSGSGCPFCSGHRVWAGFNDLATKYPELALQADGWDPSTVSHGSDLKKRWKCGEGHFWESTVSSRALKSLGCPVCSNQKLVTGINDLATKYPVLALQADGWDPKTTHMHSTKKLPWKCDKDHQWSATVNSRANRNLNCPICSGQKILIGYNDLATTHPHLKEQIVRGDPTTVSKGSRTQFTWRCLIGHDFDAAIFNVTLGKWCPYCAGQKVMPGFNDIASKYPHLAAEACGWDPTSKSFGSGEKLEWKCPKNHVYKASANSRGNGSGCPCCSGQRLWIGYNDLYTTHPEIAAEADGWDPRKTLNGLTKKLSWKCKLGHTWKVSPSARSGRGTGCPTCAGLIVLKGFNDLQFKFPEIAAEADGWDPTTVTAFTRIRKKWKCQEGHSWTARIGGRTYMKAGCPTCAQTGFDPNQPGFLYFIDHFELDMFQIGITNFPDKRLDDHERRGWEKIQLRGPMDGHLTQQLETSCLHALEKRGAVLGHKAGIAKFDGYTEAWTKASINVTSIRQILEWVYEDEGTTND
jgi:hypothetical protein